LRSNGDVVDKHPPVVTALAVVCIIFDYKQNLERKVGELREYLSPDAIKSADFMGSV